MATTTATSASLDFGRFIAKPAGALATIFLLAVAGLVVTIKVPDPAPLQTLLLIIAFAAVGWMAVSERYVWSLAILMLYLGLADGYLKLSTDSSVVTLVRDLLLYAIVVGALVRAAVRQETVRLPPLTGWVIAWLVVVVVQLANPSNGTLLHSFASLRQHLEWVPLFFLAFMVMTTRARLRGFLFLLVGIAAINGVIGLVQLELTPGELSAWGPGYAKALSGEGSISARTFADEAGEAKNRPFALGGDSGFGGTVGMIAAPAALALLALAKRPGTRVVTALLSIGVVMAIATSEARTAVIGSFIAVFAFALLSVTSRNGLRTVLAVGLAVVVAYGTTSVLASHTSEGSFERYKSISNPGKALSTAFEYRKNTLARVPTYAVEYPLGEGFGSHGAAASFGGGVRFGTNSESEPTFLLLEVGIPGLLVMLSFNLTLLYLCVSRIRRIEDRETRLLLTGIAAPLFAIFSTWFAGIATTSVPGAPYLWFAAGLVAYWLVGDQALRKPLQRRWSNALSG